ncbi:hypothetical protein DSM112329_05237 [Paraconexibacter sp. AEG42_29]|uniref:Sporulation stage II protein D amidase enhancer LytB N-terminal domain-containing protein n=1 Tax=Paraconexibacter sp. AEG42_29 TaxID=2997339 RepID=A0AAU7B2U8_9ACTN
MSRRPLVTRLVTVCLAALAAGGASAGPAGAAPAGTLTIDGRGFGHGVGLSQYGAYGFAQRGYSYRQILAHYYRETQIGSTSTGQEMTVALASGRRSYTVTQATNAGGLSLDPGRAYRLSASKKGGVVVLDDTGKRLGRTPGSVRVSAGGAPVKLLGRSGDGLTDGQYRGALDVAPAGGLQLGVVNAVPLEDYVRGVVGAESPSGWPAAALRAQAVAARTYAIATGSGGTLHADTRSQVYRGIAAETASTDAAVAGTRGEVVTYKGTPIVAYFFSTSGGRTESVQHGFPGADPKPYLVSVKDPYDGSSPKHTWRMRMTLAAAEAKLGPLVKGSLRRIVILQRGVSRRIVRARIDGTGGTTLVDAATLKKRFGLFDTWARFSIVTTGAARKTERRRVTIRVLPAGDAEAVAAVASDGDVPAGGWALFSRLAASAAADRPAVAPAPTGWAGLISVTRQIAQPTTGTVLAAPTPAARIGTRKVRVKVLRGRVAVTGRRVGGTLLRVQRGLGDGRWRTVATTKATRSGTFAVKVARSGVYRVRTGALTGPNVRVG